MSAFVTTCATFSSGRSGLLPMCARLKENQPYGRERGKAGLTNHVKHEVPYQKAQCHSTAKQKSSRWKEERVDQRRHVKGHILIWRSVSSIRFLIREHRVFFHKVVCMFSAWLQLLNCGMEFENHTQRRYWILFSFQVIIIFKKERKTKKIQLSLWVECPDYLNRKFSWTHRWTTSHSDASQQGCAPAGSRSPGHGSPWRSGGSWCP